MCSRFPDNVIRPSLYYSKQGIGHDIIMKYFNTLGIIDQLLPLPVCPFST